MVKNTAEKVLALSMELQLSSIMNLMSIIDREIEKQTSPDIVWEAIAMFIYALMSNTLANLSPEIHEEVVNTLLQHVKYIYDNRTMFPSIPIATTEKQ